jgi:hypothetical protein
MDRTVQLRACWIPSFSGGQPGDIGPVETEQQAVRRTGGGVRRVLLGGEVL